MSKNVHILKVPISEESLKKLEFLDNRLDSIYLELVELRKEIKAAIFCQNESEQ